MAVETKAHPIVGRKVVYRDPYGREPEEGVITSVRPDLNVVFVRYGMGDTSASTVADERLSFLDGTPVKEALR